MPNNMSVAGGSSATARNDAADRVLLAIARQEDAIANLLHAESENVRWAISMSATRGAGNASDITELNKMVYETALQLSELESLLRDKLWMTLVAQNAGGSCFCGGMMKQEQAAAKTEPTAREFPNTQEHMRKRKDESKLEYIVKQEKVGGRRSARHAHSSIQASVTASPALSVYVGKHAALPKANNA